MTSLFETESAQAPSLVEAQFKRLRNELPAIIERLDQTAPALVATIARGSSDNAAAFAAYLVGLRLGLPAASLPPSLASIYGAPLRLERSLALVVSQSGASPDLCIAARKARASGALTLAVVNQPGSLLSEAADATIEIGAGTEYAVAASKTFVLSATALTHLVAEWARDRDLVEALERLPAVLRDGAQVIWHGALDTIAQADDVFVVGRGAALPLAQELALKVKEVCGIHAQATSAAELLHGPIAIASAAMPALVFEGDPHSSAGVREAIARLHETGAPVTVLSTGDGTYEPGTQVVRMPRAGHALLQPLASLHAAYAFVADIARLRGRDPDRPPHLIKVTQTL